jgi:hypothetical protein
MIFFIALSVSLTGAAALLLQQFRSRSLAARGPEADDVTESEPDERQAA